MLEAQKETMHRVLTNQLPHYSRGFFAIDADGSQNYFSSQDEMERAIPETNPLNPLFDPFLYTIIDVAVHHSIFPPKRNP